MIKSLKSISLGTCIATGCNDSKINETSNPNDTYDTHNDDTYKGDTSDTGIDCMKSQNEIHQQPLYQDLVLITYNKTTRSYGYEATVLESLAVPEVIFRDDRFFAYVVDGSEGPNNLCEKLGIITSKDGHSWEYYDEVKISGLMEGMLPVDPSIIILELKKKPLYIDYMFLT